MTDRSTTYQHGLPQSRIDESPSSTNPHLVGNSPILAMEPCLDRGNMLTVYFRPIGINSEGADEADRIECEAAIGKD